MIERIPLADDYARPARPDWRSRDWPRFERRVTLPTGELNVCDVGSGDRAFVLVHGMGGRWQHWLENVPFLAEHRRVVAIDLPGFGRSQPLSERVSVAHLADCVADVCRALGVERVTLLGHSMGGPIAIQFGSRHRDLADALVLVAGPVFSFSRVLSVRRAPEVAARRPAVAAAVVTEVLAAGAPTPRALHRPVAARRRLRRAALWPYVSRPEDLPAETADLLVGGAGARGVFPTARAIGQAEPMEGLEEVGCPILSINGERDLITPVADVERFAALCPRAEVAQLEGSGHMVMLERAQAFNAWLGARVVNDPPERASAASRP